MAYTEDTDIKVLQSIGGMNSDGVLSQIPEGRLTFARNAVVENFDGKQITYQNEQSNEFCMEFKKGFKVIGFKNLIEQNRTIYFLTNPETGESEIGQKLNDSCTYATIISDPCLNFNISRPVHKIVPKTTNCSTQIYWTDGTARRWMDFDDLPFREIPDPQNEYKTIKVEGDVDCNKLLVQPNFSIPSIKPTRQEVGGQLLMGGYQFSIQYANSKGENYTGIYGITNVIGIFESKVTTEFNLPTTKAIALEVSGLDTTGLWDYFNLIVTKTINGIPATYLVGTFPINGKNTFSYVYTGNDVAEQQLSEGEVFERFPYYDEADDLTSTDDTLMWSGLRENQDLNFQKIWSQVTVYWETWVMPYNKFQAYNNPINTSELRGYMRDEIHALEGCFLLKNGKITNAGALIGREATDFDREIISNKDAFNAVEDPCAEPVSKQRWEVYNTASLIDFCDEYKNAKDKSCYIGPYQYGQFGFWESTRKYANNQFIWGSNAGRNIRWFRFPDCEISPIHSNNELSDENFQYVIFPMGIRVDMNSLYSALENSDLTQEEKDQIAGFKILRGNRATNKSIIAKGLLYNVGEYKRDNSEYFYPNYPFNDLNPDVFLSNVKVQDHSGDNAANRLQGFGENSKQRFTFHSPDTHFNQPYFVDSGYLKMETVEYGKSTGHFVPIKNNAEYKFLTRDAIRVAFAMGMSSIVGLQGGFAGLSSGVQAKVDLSNVMPVFQTTLELLKNITPPKNYGYNFNSIGVYGNSYPIKNEGNKIRAIELGEYMRGSSGTEPVGDIKPFNNFDRESSVFLKVADSIPFPHEVDPIIPADNSRFTISQNNCEPFKLAQKDICAYYGAIKRVAPDLWGAMYSYETIDTGFYHDLYDSAGNRFDRVPTVFGGDTYINRFALKRKLPFFIDHTVNRSEGADINLDDLGNIGFPIYYYSTKPVDLNVDISDLDFEINILTNTGFGNVFLNLLSAGTKPFIAGLIIATRVLTLYIQSLGVPNVNLDCPSTLTLNEVGYAYQFAYGIPYFFVESQINVDYRQATNEKEGDFFPHVSNTIPDDWLQETNVPIRQDNTYTYNNSYSKQIKEIVFPHLREDFDPDKLCLKNFPNRLIYSQKSSLEETKNNWLIYRPASYKDLPKEFGTLTSIDGLEDRKVLTRFENKSLLYNVMSTLNSSTGLTYVGDPTLFSQKPLDFAQTDLGFTGSQNKFLLKTENGHLFIDAKRGHVFLFGAQMRKISDIGMEKWFQENLEFRIRKSFPLVPIDNHFNGVGLTGVFDSKYDRFIITKKDYIPLDNQIIYNHSFDKFFLSGNEIFLKDTRYFCNVSWTISYSLKTNSWISFHSYVPNYYVGHPNFFETGIDEGLYIHNKAITFQNFYGKIEDYILEYPLFSINEEILGCFYDYTTVLKYSTPEIFVEIEDGVYFNKAWIENNQQFTGLLNLVPKPKNNLAAYKKYPIIRSDSKDILVTKSDGVFNINQFWDIVKIKDVPFFKKPCNIISLDKVIDNTPLDYGIRSHQKTKIRGRECKIRLIQDKTDQYKFISKFLITESQKSYK